MSKNPILVAIDGGSGNIAIRFNKDGKTISQISPALVRAGNLQTGAVESGTSWVTLGASGQQETYSVIKSGDNTVNTCDPAYQTSAAHRVLVVNALAAAGLGGQDVIIADTLPADQFYAGDGKIDSARIQAKKDSLMMPVSNYTGAILPPRIVDVKVYPEAVPAYYSAYFLPDGNVNPIFDAIRTAIVVDVGRFTCDIAVINSDYQVVHRRTSEKGVHIMLQRLHVLIQENQAALGIKEAKEISLGAMDDIVRQGYIGSRIEAFASRRKDVRHLIAQAASELAEIIREEVRQAHRNLADVDVMLVVGGGANYIGGNLPHLEDYTANWESPVIIPEEPEYAIVRGVHISMLQEYEAA